MKGGAVKGERNIGAMRAESVSQELAEMARDLLEHPGATLRRSALVHAVADLMDNNLEQCDQRRLAYSTGGSPVGVRVRAP